MSLNVRSTLVASFSSRRLMNGFVNIFRQLGRLDGIFAQKSINETFELGRVVVRNRWVRLDDLEY